MKPSLLLALALSAPAFAEVPRYLLSKGFSPNPTIVNVTRVPGGAMAVERFVTCKGSASEAMVSKAPALIIDVPENAGRVTVQASQGDGIAARLADGSMVCTPDKSLTLEPKAGQLELFVVTASKVDDGPAKIRLMDPDRARALPDWVKTVKVAAKGTISLEGELASPPATTPDLQLDVTADLEGIQWKVYGNAAEVWISTLAGEGKPPVKAPEKLLAGRYAVWIRGATLDAKGAYTVVGVPQGTATGGDPLKFMAKPASDAPVEGRVLTAFMPGLDPEAMKGWSSKAQALRKRAFTELPGEFFVFAAADGEVLLPLSFETGEMNVIAADGATFSLPLNELALKPTGGSPLVRAGRSEIVEKLSLQDLASEKDPRVKALEKMRTRIMACVEKHPEWTDAAQRCNVPKLEKTTAKLEADLRKAYEKRRAAELAQVERHVKAVVEN